MTECDFDPQTVSVRMEIYLDEASTLIASWFPPQTEQELEWDWLLS